MERNEIPVIRNKCVDCGASFEAPLYSMVAIGKYCASCRARRLLEFEQNRAQSEDASLAYRRREWIENPEIGVPRRYWGYEWEDFRFDMGGEGNQGKVKAIRAFAENFPVGQRPYGYESLVLSSPQNGVGKTLLVSLILKTLLMRYTEAARENPPYQFWTVGSLKRRLRASQRFSNPENEAELYKYLGSIDLLILDDVGKEHIAGADSSFNYDMYFSLLDERYQNRLPTVVTTNLSTVAPWEGSEFSLVDLMGRAAVSRLMEMTGRVEYVIEGEDRR